MKIDKKFWLVAGIVVLIVVGVGIYFWLSKGSTALNTTTSGSIPPPPALPK